jgi:hypothetical protein
MELYKSGSGQDGEDAVGEGREVLMFNDELRMCELRMINSRFVVVNYLIYTTYSTDTKLS